MSRARCHCICCLVGGSDARVQPRIIALDFYLMHVACVCVCVCTASRGSSRQYKIDKDIYGMYYIQHARCLERCKYDLYMLGGSLRRDGCKGARRVVDKLLFVGYGCTCWDLIYTTFHIYVDTNYMLFLAIIIL